VGVQFVLDNTTGRQRIATELLDQDSCFSIFDKMLIRQELLNQPSFQNTTAQLLPDKVLQTNESYKNIPAPENEYKDGVVIKSSSGLQLWSWSTRKSSNTNSAISKAIDDIEK
jgi:hypothetical protein